jgi:hypothetical protein
MSCRQRKTSREGSGEGDMTCWKSKSIATVRQIGAWKLGRGSPGTGAWACECKACRCVCVRSACLLPLTAARLGVAWGPHFAVPTSRS